MLLEQSNSRRRKYKGLQQMHFATIPLKFALDIFLNVH